MIIIQIVKCGINFSEGKRTDIVELIINEVRNTEGARLAESKSRDNFNRTSLAFFGDLNTVKQAALAVSKKALEFIDMTTHHGDHARIGAVDVVSFAPIKNITLEECIQASVDFAKEFAARFDVPVYLFDESATQPDRKDLWNVRTGEYEALASRLTKSEHKPDFGPAEFRPKAGATAIGAGNLLVIHYIDLGTPDIMIANKIVEAVSEKHGGLVNVKARAIKLEDRGITRIPISNVNYEKTPLYRQFELVKAEAARFGVSVVGSVIGGIIPLDAIVETAKYYLRLEGFKKEQILELLLQEDGITQK